MGQAKQRGTLEQRIKAAEEKAATGHYYGELLTIENIREELGLGDDCEAMGYVIHLPDNDEFLAAVEYNEHIFRASYTRFPELALVYDAPEAAIKVAKQITKHKILVCTLLSDSRKYYIKDLWANY